jgi:hypothetical protein
LKAFEDGGKGWAGGWVGRPAFGDELGKLWGCVWGEGGSEEGLSGDLMGELFSGEVGEGDGAGDEFEEEEGEGECVGGGRGGGLGEGEFGGEPAPCANGAEGLVAAGVEEAGEGEIGEVSIVVCVEEDVEAGFVVFFGKEDEKWIEFWRIPNSRETANLSEFLKLNSKKNWKDVISLG